MLVTLALAIGACTAVFTVVDETLLRRAPFAFADRLVDVLDTDRATGTGGSSLTPEKIAGWQTSPLFERFEGYSPKQFDIIGDGEPERALGVMISTGFLPMLGVQPTLGRGFAVDEGRPGSPQVVIIGDGLWNRRFGGRADVLGRSLTLSGDRYTIIGVMPRRFHLLGSTTRADVLWLPVDLAHPGGEAGPQFYGLARLAPGVAVDSVQARANLLADQYQTTRPLQRTWGLSISPKRVSTVAASTQTVLLTLLGAVAFVLLIACANVANLLLSRAAAREREMAVRSALGASRGRLIREVLVESVLLALIGGAAGLLIANWSVSAAMALAPLNLSSQATTTIEIDRRVLAVAFSLTLLAGLAVGLVPALRGSRVRLEETLRSSGLTLSRRRSFGMSGGLVVLEVALALVLLVGAALTMRTFSNLHAINPGFEMHGLVTERVALPPERYATEAARFTFANQLAQRLAALPGVTELSIASNVPPPGVGSFSVGLDGENSTADTSRRVAQNAVDSNFFRTMGIPLRAGRTFSADDSDAVVIVSQTVADHYWPGAPAVGRRIRLGPTQPRVTVIGVVGSVEMWMGDTRLSWQLYFPHNQSKGAASTAPSPRASRGGGFTVTMRTAHVNLTAAAVKPQVWSVDKDLPLESPTVIENQWDDIFGRQRFALQLMGAFAIIALILATAGIFAVLSQIVNQRTREIGVRVALGAAPRDIVHLIVSRGLTLALAGIVIGLGGATALSRVLRSVLFQVSPYDPASFAVVTALLVAVALAACWLPARRAARVDPMIALRAE